MTATSDRRPPRRHGLRGGLLAVVVAGHVALLAGMGAPMREGTGLRPAAAARAIVVGGLTAPPATPPVAAASVAAPPPRVGPQAPSRRAAPATLPGRGDTVDAPPRWPTYATQVPPPFTRRYRLQRGDLTGRGVLEWRPDGDAYAASFVAELGTHSFRWESRGAFDTAGVAPQRHVDRRPRRGAQAANFRRDDGRILYSGPPVEHLLAPGAQDRLSWLVQLAAIVRGRDELPSAGNVVTLFVTGARGDADRWDFVVDGLEHVTTSAGRQPALRLTREPQRRYDLRVQIWLDARADRLPVRVLTTPTGPAPPLEWIADDVPTAE